MRIKYLSDKAEASLKYFGFQEKQMELSFKMEVLEDK